MTDAPRSFDTFISYASANRERAAAICEHLESRGLRCWIAPRDLRPGNEYGDEIVSGIRDSRCLVLVLSAAANESPMVRREVERAVSLNRPVFPVRIEDVLPARSLEFFVSTTHAVDAWQGALGAHIDRLADEVGNERMVSELGAKAAERVKRRRAMRRVSLSAVGVAVVAVLAGILALSAGGTATSQPDEVKADFAAYGIDVTSIDESDFNLELVFPTAHSPAIRVTSAKPGRDVVTIGVLQGRVGDRPWHTLTWDMQDSRPRIHHLDDRELQTEGKYQLRFIAGSMDGDAKSYGPYTFDFPFWTMLDEERAERFEALRERAEREVWLNSPGFWMIDTEFPNLARVVESIDFGVAPDALNSNFVVPRAESNSTMPGSFVVGRHVDEIGLRRSVRDFIKNNLGEVDVVYARLRYLDEKAGDVRRFPPAEHASPGSQR